MQLRAENNCAAGAVFRQLINGVATSCYFPNLLQQEAALSTVNL